MLLHDTRRIDWVQLRHEDPNAEGAIQWKTDIHHLALWIHDKYGDSPLDLPFEFMKYYDVKLRRHVDKFNIWGPLANDFARHMTTQHWRDCSRLDWRIECDETHMAPIEALHYARLHKKKSRSSIDYRDTPPRKKTEDRDAGGESLTVGTRNYGARVCFYRRGEELPAIEVQFEGKLIREIIQQTALLASRYSREHGKAAMTMYDVVCERLDSEHDHWVLQKLGITRYQLGLEEETQDGIPLETYSEPEQLLMEFEDIYQQMPEDAKEVARELVNGGIQKNKRVL